MGKVNIIEVSTIALVFTVGRPATPFNGAEPLEIESIGYEKNGYNKGRQGEFPAYVIYFVGGALRKILPQDKVTSVVAEFLDETANNEIIPELP